MRLWARLQREVEHKIGLIGVLFVLNWFTIFWQNLHYYQNQQLVVLAVDFFFVLGGTALYVALLGLLPVKAVGRGLLFMSFFLSALLGGLECFALWNYQAQIGAGIITAVMQTNPQEAGEFFARYVGIFGVVLSIGFFVLCVGIWHYMQALRWKYHANDEQVEAPSMDVKLVEGMLNDCLEAIQDILPSSAPVRAL